MEAWHGPISIVDNSGSNLKDGINKARLEVDTIKTVK